MLESSAMGTIVFLGLCAPGQVFVAPHYDPFAPPVAFAPAPVVAMRMPAPPTETKSGEADRAKYPPTSKVGPRIVHERHYVPRGTNVSQYMAERKTSEYGPEVQVVIRDFYFTDDKLKEVPNDRKSSASAPPPKNSSDGDVDRMMKEMNEGDRNAGEKSGIKPPDPKEADPKKNGSANPSDGKAKYAAPETPQKKAPNEEKSRSEPLAKEPETRQSPPAAEGGKSAPAAEKNAGEGEKKDGANPAPPSNALTAKWQVVRGTVVSARGGTPLASMKLDFVHLGEGERERDATANTDAAGRFDARLEPGVWQVYLVVAPNERRSLGSIEVKAGDAATPLDLKF